MVNPEQGCCQIVGGIVEVYVAGQSIPIKADADVTLLGPYEYEGFSTMAGEFHRTQKIHPVELQLTAIRTCDGDLSLLAQGCSVDVTVREPGPRIVHRLSKAGVLGRPEVNLSSGEISGLSIGCGNANYSRSTY